MTTPISRILKFCIFVEPQSRDPLRLSVVCGTAAERADCSVNDISADEEVLVIESRATPLDNHKLRDTQHLTEHHMFRSFLSSIFRGKCEITATVWFT